MKSIFSTQSTGKFARNVATVASGAAFAQAISLAFSPIITRLYGPESFGVQGVFVSVVMLLSTVVTLGYPTAIVLAKSDVEAAHISDLSVFSAVIITIAITLLTIAFGSQIVEFLNIEAIGKYIFLLPVAVFFSGISGLLTQWFVRNHAFGAIAKCNSISSLVVNFLKASGGFLHPSGLLLIVLSTCGNLLTSLINYVAWIRYGHKTGMKVERSKGPGGMLEASAKYWDFALLRTPQNLLNAISHSMPIVLLGTYFGPAVAGYYGIALAVLSVPGNIIGQSVITVFYPRITRSIADKEDSRRLIIKATLIMAILGLAPYAIIASMGPFLFQFVFGEDWRVAGEYAQWMAPLLFLQFVNRPAVASVPALRIQGGLLVYEVFSTATKIGSLWMGFHFYNSAEVSVALFALLGVIAYLWLIVWIIFRSRVDSNT